jgi:hypothetical protein
MHSHHNATSFGLLKCDYDVSIDCNNNIHGAWKTGVRAQGTWREGMKRLNADLKGHPHKALAERSLAATAPSIAKIVGGQVRPSADNSRYELYGFTTPPCTTNTSREQFSTMAQGAVKSKSKPAAPSKK